MDVYCLVHIVLGTIHLRRRQIFTIFDPYPPPVGSFFTTIHRQLLPIFDPCTALTNAEVLDGWSLVYNPKSPRHYYIDSAYLHTLALAFHICSL